MTTLWPSARYGSPYDHLVILRCTKKLLAIIGLALTAEPAPAPDPEDWYANLLWFDRRKCLLLTHSVTLFSIFEPDVRPSGLRATRHLVTRLIDRELRREKLPSSTFTDLWSEEGRSGSGQWRAPRVWVTCWPSSSWRQASR